MPQESNLLLDVKIRRRVGIQCSAAMRLRMLRVLGVASRKNGSRKKEDPMTSWYCYIETAWRSYCCPFKSLAKTISIQSLTLNTR
jgi:hypothetical protein